METSSKGVGDVEGKAFAGEGAPGWEECPGEIFLVSIEECWKVISVYVPAKCPRIEMSWKANS